jgi:hypothetical protein
MPWKKKMKLQRYSLLFITFMILPCFAKGDELFKERIKLFGLDQNLATIKQTDPGQKYKIIQALKEELRTNYLKDVLQRSVESKCELGSFKDCLVENKEHWQVRLDGKSRCYPSTLCGYYQCMESEYQCSQYGVNYFTDLAYPTCSQYVQNINEGKFSKDGVEWIYSVMVCLQKGLFEECEIQGNCNKESNKKSCEHIVDYTLKFHPGCYLESGIGICNLKLKDQINIWRTVGPYLTKRERLEAYKVVKECLLK